MPQCLSIKEKIDNELKIVNNICSRLGHLREKFTGFDKQLKEIDAKFSKRCTDLGENLKELELVVKFIGNRTSDLEFIRTSDLGENLKELKLDAKFIGNRTSNLDSSATARLNDLKKKIKMNQDLSMTIRKLEKDEVIRESYSTRLSILVHGSKKQGNDKTKEQAKALFDNFLGEALEIILDSIKIVHLHRLPQHTIRKAGKAITRPIIVKLLTSFDKDKIFKNINRLKQYNDERKSRIFIMDHLPKLFYYQKKQPMPEYKAAKEDDHLAKWTAYNGDYCLHVIEKRTQPPR